MSRARGRIILSAAILGAFCAAYAASIAGRSYQMYRLLKHSGRGWTGNVFEPDADLGFRPRPGARGAELVPLGPPVPACFDALSMRIPCERPPEKGARPTILALGCSFTYGAACLAEEAYPDLVAHAVQGRAHNAAVCSYGLAQMLVRARTLIPRLRPDIVLVQYSDWLVERSMSGLAPVLVGTIPSPMLIRQSDGRIVVQPPMFMTRNFDLPWDEYRSRLPSATELASFVARVGTPLLTHDDARRLLIRWRRMRGALASQPASSDACVTATYGEIARWSRDAGARVLVVLIGPFPSDARRRQLAAYGQVVDAQAALCAEVPGGCLDRCTALTAAYYRRFGQLRGQPPRLVDPHPSPAAHSVIARTIVAALAQPPLAVPEGGR